MPQVSPEAFRALPLRIHALLRDVPLHDVWSVDLPASGDALTLVDFERRAKADGVFGNLPFAGRALVRLRLVLGKIFGLETRGEGANADSFSGRLTPDDRLRSLEAPGTAHGMFRTVYRFDNENLLELQNRTAHAAALSALVPTPNGYRFYFAVYVANTSWITPLYMALIDPFRKAIIYPAMLRNVRESWLKIA